MRKPDISVVIPTYNERSNIIPLITAVSRELRGLTYEIIVVDDNSPDGTADAVLAYGRTHQAVICIRRTRNHGLAASIREGIGAARGTVIVGMDADFNHDPGVIRSLIGTIRGYKLVVASRFVRGGGMGDRWRYATSLAFNMLLRIIFGFPVTDNTSGFYAIRKRDVMSLDADAIYRGYGEYHLRLVYRAMRKGFPIAEIPVYYSQRTAGVSKSRFSRMIVDYLRTAWRLVRDSE